MGMSGALNLANSAGSEGAGEVHEAGCVVHLSGQPGEHEMSKPIVLQRIGDG